MYMFHVRIKVSMLGMTCHHMSNLGQMFQTPRLLILALRSITFTYDLTTTLIRTQARGCLTKKNTIVVGCLSVVAGYFCWPCSLLLLFVTFLLLVTFVNYFLLLKVHFLLFFFTFINYFPIHMISTLRS
jgi:hypothetical protein